MRCLGETLDSAGAEEDEATGSRVGRVEVA